MMETDQTPPHSNARTWWRPPRHLIAAFVVLVGLTWIFFEIGEEVGERETGAFDEAILLFFRRGSDHAHIIGPDWMKTVATQFTALGSSPVIALLVLVVVGYLLVSRHYWRALEVALTTIGGAAIALGLKAMYARPRPTLVPRLVEVSNYSFPSGHSAISAVVYLTLGALIARFATTWRQRLYAVAVACALTLVVGWTRVALGVHYPTDVIAGWALGLAWALLSWTIANARETWKARV